LRIYSGCVRMARALVIEWLPSKTGTMHDALRQPQGGTSQPASTIGDVVASLQQRIDALPHDQVHRRIFVKTYQRTTQAVGEAVDSVFFEDPEWVVRLDIAFAGLFIVAHDADQAGLFVPRPWRLAFQADPKLPTLSHLLPGMNAHINYDLPQATLSVITDQDFQDPLLIDMRRRDHERIDKILATRVTAEDHAIGGTRSLLDRILTAANRLSSRRFLHEARQKVWLNVAELQRARLDSADIYRARLAELEVLSAAKIADLLRPGQVLLRLALTGFGACLRQRRRRKRLGASKTPNPPTADAPNVVWAVDFQFDATTDGRPIKIVSIVDEHTRECLGGPVERNITGRHLIDELDRLSRRPGLSGRAALRQRPRARLRRDGRLGRRTRRPALHPTRPALAQRLHRVAQQPGARRMPQHQHVLISGSGAGGDQRLEGGLQPPPATLRARLPGASCPRCSPRPSMIDSH
jgi:hypothetical protein